MVGNDKRGESFLLSLSVILAHARIQGFLSLSLPLSRDVVATISVLGTAQGPPPMA